MFRVLLAETGEPVSDETFPSAQAANAYAAGYRAMTGKRVRIARIVTEAWRERELARLADGTYKPLPAHWTNAAWWQDAMATTGHAARDHYAHLADDGERIAFTESPQKGEEDKQLVLSVSRYLARFFADRLAPHEIAQIAQSMGAADYPMHTSDKPEDFARIYSGQGVGCDGARGVLSCMRHPAKWFGTELHPAYVYGAGDLRIAWLQEPDADELTVLARSVVYPARGVYVRIYAREERHAAMLAKHLADAGFDRGDSLEGARLLRIEEGTDRVLMPYIDGDVQTVEEYRDGYLRIAEDGDIDGAITGGTARVASRMRCDHCGDSMDEDDTYGVDGETWCEDCYSNHTFHCESCDESYPDSQANPVVARYGTRLFCDHCARHEAFACDHTGNRYTDQHHTQIFVQTRHGEETWCEEVNTVAFFTSDRTDTNYARRDFTPIRVEIAGEVETWCAEEDAIPEDAVVLDRVEDARQSELSI